MVRRHPATLFAISALAVLTACVAILRSAAFVRNPDVAAWGVTFDLTISLPLLYWFFVVRTGKAQALTMAPVFIAGTIVATLLVPRQQQHFLEQLKWIVGPAAELLILVTVVRGVRTGDSRIAEFVRAEASMFYYAIFGWTKKPEREGITFHQQAGWGSILACIFVLLAAEGLGMHLLLGQWSMKAAWIWTGLDLWAAIWLLGDYHGLRLRHSFVDDDAFHLRLGMRWSLSIPRENIAAIEPIRNESEWKKRKDVLKVAILDEPRWLLTLREPMTAHGLAGLRKTVTALALRPDDDAALSALSHGLSARDTPAALR
jgi:hypothetical protein